VVATVAAPAATAARILNQPFWGWGPKSFAFSREREAIDR